ncbi:hypothetical protein PGT21_003802 [Puccinia graminis f. sp. tritici]|uniref:Uncharacterized protein n=1 Tax=Puccinia graminis f. sp. tritici TaxID=56615 RepID=A0A5B0NBI5_PUCGR|nr:hypothetical protein PGT21_003802 [Puccinia graminis f. sp. tritici]KAA1118433.1 hypothetical protein PGTUg99_003758 [Puccinia graminis f. sp. tritici]
MTNPSASTSSTHSTTTTATHIVNEDDGAGLVYWEDHQQQNKKLIEQVNSPENSHSNSNKINKRNSTLAGIPSPSKPTTTSARTELLQPTHQNNQKALRQTKRRKNRAALTHSDHEPPKITKPSTKPPLLPKQMAWQELASRLKRRELDSISETPQTRSTTNQSLSKTHPTRVFPSSSSSSVIAPNLENRSHQPTLPQTSATKPALKSILRSSSNATHQKGPLQNNPNPKSTVTIVSEDSPSCQDDSSRLNNQPQMRNQSTKPCQPIREVPGCVSKQKPSVPAGISAKKSIPADSKTNAAQSGGGGGGGCEPWELEEDDDEFGSQLLELADLVEKEQKMSQEIALPSDRNRGRSTTRLSSSKTCIASHSNTTTPPWKTVDNSRKRAPASIRGTALPPAPTTNINQLLPPKSNIITNQQQQNDRTVKRAQPVVLKQKSPIIYKTAMVSKASMPPTSVHPNPVEGRRKNLGVVGTPKQVGPKPADEGLSANNRPSSLHNPAQKLTYSDALIRPRRLQIPLDPTHSALRIRPLLHNPSPTHLIHHPLPPPAIKSAVSSSSSSSAAATAVHKTLDLESLFCGIQGDDLDWDPNDQ